MILDRGLMSMDLTDTKKRALQTAYKQNELNMHNKSLSPRLQNDIFSMLGFNDKDKLYQD